MVIGLCSTKVVSGLIILVYVLLFLEGGGEKLVMPSYRSFDATIILRC